MLRSLFVLALLPVLNMCGSADRAAEPAVYSADAGAPTPYAEAQDAGPAAKAGTSAVEPPLPAARMLIYTGSLRMQVDRLDTATARVRALTARVGGYLSGEATEHYGTEQRMTLTIRVPARQFRTLIGEVEGLGTYIAEKSIQAEDITEEFRDNEARLKARRATEAQLLTILQRTRTVDEVLKVQEQLQRVREEIEVTEGRNRYLADRVAYSTLTVTLYELVPQALAPQEGFFYKLWTSVVDGWSILKQLVLALVTAWPILLIGGGIVWWVVRRERRRRAAAPKPPAT